MRYFAILTMLLIFSNCQKEFQNTLPDFFILSPDWVQNGDTITVPVQTEIEFRTSFSSDLDSNFEGKWDFGDDTFSNKIRSFHSYTERGLYAVSFKLSNGVKEVEINYFVKVVGQIIGRKDTPQSGFYVNEINSDTYLFYYGESNNFFMQKMQNYNETFTKQILGKNKDLIEIEPDNESNFNILSEEGFAKVDMSGYVITNKSYDYTYKGHVYKTSSNEYLVTSSNLAYTIYDKLDNLGQRLARQQIYRNADTVEFCSDAIFINDTEYFLLLNESAYHNSNGESNLILSKRNIENNIKTDIIISDIHSNDIKKVSDGYILYGFDLEESCIGCDSYLNLIKISSDLSFEWKRIINLGDIHYNWNTFNDKVVIQEYDDKFLFFQGRSVFILDKSGVIIKSKRYFEGVNFRINSACQSNENTLVLGTINNDYSYTIPTSIANAFMFKIDKDGLIVY